VACITAALRQPHGPGASPRFLSASRPLVLATTD
jgi:hypothetical protein